MEKVTDFIFLGSKITVDSDYSHEIKRHLIIGRKTMTNLSRVLKKQRHHFADKGLYSQSYGFSISHVQMWELYHKMAEGGRIEAVQPWCWRLESPLHGKEIKPVNHKGNQLWIFIWRTDAEAPNLWTPDEKNWLIGKYPDAGKVWRLVQKGMTEDKMVGWYHWLDGHEFEQALEIGDGQGSLVCCSPWGHKE